MEEIQLYSAVWQCCLLIIFGINGITNEKYPLQFWKLHEITSLMEKKWVAFIEMQITFNMFHGQTKSYSSTNLSISMFNQEPLFEILLRLYKHDEYKVKLFKACKKDIISGSTILSNICLFSKERKLSGLLIFNPIYHFHVNMTFMHFQLSLGMLFLHTGWPRFDYFWPKDNRDYIIEYLKISECHSENSDTCHVEKMNGVYPIHCRYFIFYTTKLSWTISPLFNSGIFLVYQIIGSDLISEFKLTHTYNEIFLKDFTHRDSIGVRKVPYQDITFLNKKIQINVYRVVTLRVKVIKISWPRSEMFRVFDGPDLKSIEIITSNKQSHNVSTSFQLTIISWGWLADSKVILVSKLGQYTLLNITKLPSHNIKTFPWNSCIYGDIKYCTLKISTTKLSINATVLSLKYSGPSMIGDHCLFGGIVIYSKHEDGNYKQQMLECENIDSTFIKDSTKIMVPSIFSHFGSSEMWIAGFSYNCYSVITGLLSIESTDCKSIPYSPKKIRCAPNIQISGYSEYLSFKGSYFTYLITAEQRLLFNRELLFGDVPALTLFVLRMSKGVSQRVIY